MEYFELIKNKAKFLLNFSSVKIFGNGVLQALFHKALSHLRVERPALTLKGLRPKRLANAITAWSSKDLP